MLISSLRRTSLIGSLTEMYIFFSLVAFYDSYRGHKLNSVSSFQVTWKDAVDIPAEVLAMSQLSKLKLCKAERNCLLSLAQTHPLQTLWVLKMTVARHNHVRQVCYAMVVSGR